MGETVFVTATCANDVHYCKALLGSINYFHPETPIYVIADHSVSTHDVRQISRFPNVELLKVSDLNAHTKMLLTGLLTKLNLLLVDPCFRTPSR